MPVRVSGSQAGPAAPDRGEEGESRRKAGLGAKASSPKPGPCSAGARRWRGRLQLTSNNILCKTRGGTLKHMQDLSRKRVLGKITGKLQFPPPGGCLLTLVVWEGRPNCYFALFPQASHTRRWQTKHVALPEKSPKTWAKTTWITGHCFSAVLLFYQGWTKFATLRRWCSLADVLSNSCGNDLCPVEQTSSMLVYCPYDVNHFRI